MLRDVELGGGPASWRGPASGGCHSGWDGGAGWRAIDAQLGAACARATSPVTVTCRSAFFGGSGISRAGRRLCDWRRCEFQGVRPSVVLSSKVSDRLKRLQVRSRPGQAQRGEERPTLDALRARAWVTREAAIRSSMFPRMARSMRNLARDRELLPPRGKVRQSRVIPGARRGFAVAWRGGRGGGGRQYRARTRGSFLHPSIRRPSVGCVPGAPRSGRRSLTGASTRSVLSRSGSSWESHRARSARSAAGADALHRRAAWRWRVRRR